MCVIMYCFVADKNNCVNTHYFLDIFVHLREYVCMTSETVLYGIPQGETERYAEVLLLTNATPELIERVKVLAAKDAEEEE